MRFKRVKRKKETEHDDSYINLVGAIAELLPEVDYEKRQDIGELLDKYSELTSDDRVPIGDSPRISIDFNMYDLIQIGGSCLVDLSTQMTVLDKKIARGNEPDRDELEKVYLALRVAKKADDAVRELLTRCIKEIEGGDVHG